MDPAAASYIRRELAPYLGVEWQRSFGGTVDMARAADERVEDVFFVLGWRAWY